MIIFYFKTIGSVATGKVASVQSSFLKANWLLILSTKVSFRHASCVTNCLQYTGETSRVKSSSGYHILVSGSKLKQRQDINKSSASDLTSFFSLQPHKRSDGST